VGGSGEGDGWEDERGEVSAAVEVGRCIAKKRDEKNRHKRRRRRHDPGRPWLSQKRVSKQKGQQR